MRGRGLNWHGEEDPPSPSLCLSLCLSPFLLLLLPTCLLLLLTLSFVFHQSSLVNHNRPTRGERGVQGARAVTTRFYCTVQIWLLLLLSIEQTPSLPSFPRSPPSSSVQTKRRSLGLVNTCLLSLRDALCPFFSFWHDQYNVIGTPNRTSFIRWW